MRMQQMQPKNPLICAAAKDSNRFRGCGSSTAVANTGNTSAILGPKQTMDVLYGNGDGEQNIAGTPLPPIGVGPAKFGRTRRTRRMEL